MFNKGLEQQYKEHTRKVIEEINQLPMSDVLNKLTGITLDERGNCDCPIHGTNRKNKKNASVNIHGGNNKITCWSRDCLRGSSVFNLLDKYYREVQGVRDWKEVYKRIDNLLGTNLHLDIRSEAKKRYEADKQLYTHEFKVDKYVDEVRFDLLQIVEENQNICINAGTGVGKTTALRRLGNQLLSKVDIVFFLTARKSIVEEISEDNDNGIQYTAFMGSDWIFGNEQLIVATTHKARAINYALETNDLEYIEGYGWKAIERKYAVIVDECHLLHSARNIIGSTEELNTLIKGAEYSIFMSANSNHFYKASKDTYNLNAYVNVERKERIYNLDSLEIYRLNANEGGKELFLADLILQEKNKVLFINNDIAFNKKLVEELQATGKHAVEINAQNKDSEAYENIIKQSLLSEEVTICTSVIDTGVNIKSEKITTIIGCNCNTFDDISIIQGFARVRTTNGNKGILILQCNDKENIPHKISDISDFQVQYEDISLQACSYFNSHMFDNYDFNSYEEFKVVWNLLRDNSLYSNIADVLHIIVDEGNVNPRIAINEVMLYEKSRKAQLRDNYYNDKFVLDVLKPINAKTIQMKNFKRREKVDNNLTGSNSEFMDELRKIIGNDRLITALCDHYSNNKKIKDCVVFEKLLQTNEKEVKSLDSQIKKMFKFVKQLNYKVQVNYNEFISSICSSFLKEEKKEKELELTRIRYKIYNSVYGNFEYRELDSLGDIDYIVVREVFDKVKKNKNAITENHMQITVRELINRYAEMENKKLKEKKAYQIVNDILPLIYHISDKQRITSLIK